MLIRVDLPAPFSPTRPWMAPLAMEKLTSVFALTAPKCLEMPRNSTAGCIGFFRSGLLALGRFCAWLAVLLKNAPQELAPAARFDGKFPGVRDRSDRAGSARTDIDDFRLAVDDVLAGTQHLLLDFRRDQLAVVGVQRPVHARFLQA